MDFRWSDDQQRMRKAATDFASRRLRDGIAERDRDGTFSNELWDACAEFGLQGVLIPQEHGGGGHDLLTAVAIAEGIGYGALDNGMVFAVTAHAASCAGLLAEFGTDEQQREWLPKLADGSVIGATGITEANSGSNALAMETTAASTGDRWVLNGSKTFVTNAPEAGLFLLYARTADSGLGGVTCFLVPRESPGLSIGAPIEKMGLRTSPMSEVFLEECQVPSSSVVGAVDSGGMVFNQTMDIERLLVMAPAIGVMERILERCVRHARERCPGAVPISKHQSISHGLADIETSLESSRLLLYRAAWQRSCKRGATRESALAKLAVSEAYVACCRTAVQIFGGYGYMVEYGLERELRDALATTIYVGTSEIQRNLIAGLRGLG